MEGYKNLWCIALLMYSLIYLNTTVQAQSASSEEPALEFFLVNSDTDEILFQIEDGMQVDRDELDLLHFNIIVNTSDLVKSLGFQLETPYTHRQNESLRPFALFGDNTRGGYYGNPVELKTYTLQANAYRETGQQGEQIASKTIHFSFVEASEPEAVIKLSLVNAQTDEVVLEIQEGMQIDLNQYDLHQFNVVASSVPNGTNSVAFRWGERNKVENLAPHALFGDDLRGDYYGEVAAEGDYYIEATAYEARNTQGDTLGHTSLNFSLVRIDPVLPLRFFLVNADTNESLLEIQDGIEIDLAQLDLKSFNIVITQSPVNTQSTFLSLNGPVAQAQTENMAPYALFGDDTKGDYYGANALEGFYTLKGTAYNAQGRRGEILTDKTLSFTFVNPKEETRAVNTEEGTGDVIRFSVPKASQTLYLSYEVIYQHQRKVGSKAVPAGEGEAEIYIGDMNIPTSAIFYLIYQYPGEERKTLRLLK